MLEQHVVNLELSKKLHEAGLKLKTVYYWIESPNDRGTYRLMAITEDRGRENLLREGYDLLPAPLATEILEVLPFAVGGYGMLICKGINEYDIAYKPAIDNIRNVSLPDALALMWLYLKEQSII